MEWMVPQGDSRDLVSIWLRKSLPDAHDDILKAPIPEELVQLVSRFLPPR